MDLVEERMRTNVCLHLASGQLSYTNIEAPWHATVTMIQPATAFWILFMNPSPTWILYEM